MNFILNQIQKQFGHTEYSVQNSLSHLSSLQSSVIDGYGQCYRHLLPVAQQSRLQVLANRLAEGMEIEFQRLRQSDDSSVADSEREYYMAQHRLCCNHIPGYAEKMKDKVFEDF